MQRFPTQEQVKRIREQYPVGTRIELDGMENERDMPPGLKGIIKKIDDAGQLHTKWDNGRSLALIVGVDNFHIIRDEDQAKDNQILVLVVEPGKPPYEKRIDNNFRAFQELVNGGIEYVSLPEPDCHIYCNDEGKLDGLQGNRKQDNGDILCGTFVICADDGEGNEVSLNVEQLQRYQERFAEPEHFTSEEAHQFNYIVTSMEQKSPSERYVDHINANILPFIDYGELAQSYHTEDKAYAKGILNLLHTAMVEQYGTNTLSPSYNSMEDDYVIVPGVIQGMESGKIAIALLGIDLESSGEHCETDILCRYGVVSQGENKLPAAINAEIVVDFMPYNYGYTAKIPGDIHINKSRLPSGIKEMLGSFQSHTAQLLNYGIDENSENDMER